MHDNRNISASTNEFFRTYFFIPKSKFINHERTFHLLARHLYSHMNNGMSKQMGVWAAK